MAQVNTKEQFAQLIEKIRASFIKYPGYTVKTRRTWRTFSSELVQEIENFKKDES
jgi:hypothetical protein